MVSYCERPRDARHVQEAFLKLYHYPISSYLKCSQYFIRMHDETFSELENALARLAATVKEQAAQIQKVSAQVEASKPAPQVVNNP